MSKKSQAKKQDNDQTKRTLHARGYSRGGDYSCVFIPNWSQAKRRRIERR